MTQLLQRDATRLVNHPGVLATDAAQVQFREQFKRSLKSCMKHRFSVAESFGTIWQETLEQVFIPENAQRDLYEELLLWAKKWQK